MLDMHISVTVMLMRYITFQTSLFEPRGQAMHEFRNNE